VLFYFINLWLITDRHRYCTYTYYQCEGRSTAEEKDEDLFVFNDNIEGIEREEGERAENVQEKRGGEGAGGCECAYVDRYACKCAYADRYEFK